MDVGSILEAILYGLVIAFAALAGFWLRQRNERRKQAEIEKLREQYSESDDVTID